MMMARHRAKDIKMLICDVDGVLTDGGLYYDDRGRIQKRFDVQDGFGVKLAQSADLEIGVITGLESEAVRSRIMELGIQEYHFGQRAKAELLADICARKSFQFKEMAYLGDDWVDASALKKVGLPMAVKNSQKEIKELALWVAEKRGGQGALREAVHFILDCQGKLDALWQRWTS